MSFTTVTKLQLDSQNCRMVCVARDPKDNTVTMPVMYFHTVFLVCTQYCLAAVQKLQIQWSSKICAIQLMIHFLKGQGYHGEITSSSRTVCHVLSTGDQVIPLELWNCTLTCVLPCPSALCPSFGDGKHLPSNIFNAEYVLLYTIVMSYSKCESKLLLDCGCQQFGILVLFGFSVASLFSVYVFYVYKRENENIQS